MDAEHCPVCGTVGRVVSSDEGTSHFLAAPAVTETADLRAALRMILGYFDEACEYIAENPAEDDRLTAYLRRAEEARAALAAPTVTETADLRAGLREVVRAFTDDPEEAYLDAAVKIFRAALAGTSDTEEETP